MQSNFQDRIKFHQKSSRITIIYDLSPDEKGKFFKIDFQSESTSLREILSNASSSSNDLIFTILHPPTNFSLNTYSISSLNIVTVLKKLDNSEWDSLKFKFKFNNEETLIEKWFLTKENVQKCIKTLDDETKWNKTSLAPEIESTQAARDKDGIIVQIKIKPSY
ncbi:hypothetical protein RhiirA5_427820 [Rhizophagus irregularis]|uniref:CS domain-containing protein n=3 Tax=Rhizophagus irregularis TaxID=588596 RepID=U9SK35_RHIID|nr:hypothetical protein GLOIN_2v1761917 [Rhizophagus irregularis DAOM 181602=DAOM 197198]EXX72158.1 hypothetical protein RirG_072010 [Rhizophagus irregularis DAOM 197198w]PKC00692.1 hypothetical protein RhiirA5_427820 [Rhizophagus irregularis]PKC58190.1 hypothetical protein RhiirA1_471356 [Rhizophagus irregularis]PKY13592.1 hypothetical protein RhiirB3_425444 [Rhizophagus irregularis]POG82521.1 hypothetical protein GLOIN_2v1761917 [Rhizophagus irregularis DAOM 181602=DAOM 197198]|eukprot:XP_025189387.1 hypothetical protein GLOIN_2v1761917 [Rhizophagus irregularis DAOM 181602=DAOM 197198]